MHLLRVKSGDSLAIVPAQTHANNATLVVVFHVANSNRLLRWTIKLFFHSLFRYIGHFTVVLFITQASSASFWRVHIVISDYTMFGP